MNDNYDTGLTLVVPWPVRGMSVGKLVSSKNLNGTSAVTV